MEAAYLGGIQASFYKSFHWKSPPGTKIYYRKNKSIAQIQPHFQGPQHFVKRVYRGKLIYMPGNLQRFMLNRSTTCSLISAMLLFACATDDANRTNKNSSSSALGYSGGGSSVAVATGSGGYGGGSGVAVATGSGGYGGGSGVAVGVGGYGSGVAVSAGNAGAYAGTGYYGYVNNVGAVVAPVGGWYPFYYSSPLYASPVPQVYPMPQMQQSPYTYQPYFVQPVVVQQQQVDPTRP